MNESGERQRLAELLHFPVDSTAISELVLRLVEKAHFPVQILVAFVVPSQQEYLVRIENLFSRNKFKVIDKVYTKKLRAFIILVNACVDIQIL